MVVGYCGHQPISSQLKEINGLFEPCKESHPIVRGLMDLILRTGVMEVTLSYREVILADITNI